jgi:poly(hydroxyalkanoate) granule-associated protein
MATKGKKESVEVIDEVVVIEEISTNGKEEQSRFSEMLHKVLLASIGAVALAQEEIEDFIEKLVERGEIAEKDGRKMMRDVMDKRRKQAEDVAEKTQTKTEDQLNKRVEEILHRLNVPTKADIDALGVKVTELATKVDDLKKS